MRNARTLGVTLIAVLAIGGVTAAGASANKGLWGERGVAITKAESVTGKGVLKFEQRSQAGWELSCHDTSKGVVEPGGLGEISSIVATSGGTKGIECEASSLGDEGCNSFEVEARHLPWKTKLTTENTIEIEKGPAGYPEWNIVCKFAGGKYINWCHVTPSAGVKTVGEESVELVYDEKGSGTKCLSNPGSFYTAGGETWTNGAGRLGVL